MSPKIHRKVRASMMASTMPKIWSGLAPKAPATAKVLVTRAAVVTVSNL